MSWEVFSQFFLRIFCKDLVFFFKCWVEVCPINKAGSSILSSLTVFAFGQTI